MYSSSASGLVDTREDSRIPSDLVPVSLDRLFMESLLLSASSTLGGGSDGEVIGNIETYLTLPVLPEVGGSEYKIIKRDTHMSV